MQQLNVKDSPFNAVGDGKTDDTVAFQKCLSSLNSGNGGEIFIPPGTYLLQEKLFFNRLPKSSLDMDAFENRSALSIRGTGRNLSILLWVNSDGGIKFNDILFNNARMRAYLKISGLTLRTIHPTGGDAIEAAWHAGISQEAHFYVDDVRIQGATNSDLPTDRESEAVSELASWTRGVSLSSANGIKINNLFVEGSFNSKSLENPWPMQVALKIDGEIPGNINHYISNFTVNKCQVALEINGRYEGTYMRNFEFVAVDKGIRFQGKGSETPNFFVQNGHMQFRSDGAWVKNIANVKFTNVDFYKGDHIKESGAEAEAEAESRGLVFPGNALLLEDSCPNCTVTACKFESTASNRAGVRVNENGIWLTQSSSKGIINGCHFLNFESSAIVIDSGLAIVADNYIEGQVNSTGIFLTPTSSRCLVTHNNIIGNGNPVSNTVASNVITP